MGTLRSRVGWVRVGIVAFLVTVFAAALAWQYWHDILRTAERASLPREASYQEVQESVPPTLAPTAAALPTATPVTTATPRPSAPVAASTLPASVNLAVPFTAQAPHANWDEPYAELCEEASVLMAIGYLRNQDIPTPEYADQELLKIKDFEDRYFGYYKDTTAAETATILREYYTFDAVQLLADPTADDLRRALAAGRLVIVPAAGRLLGNPYFSGAGPLYHMLVLKGYTADGTFISNDPGTRRGADFLYEEAVIMNALHDWRSDGQILEGKKVVLIVG